MLKYVERVTEKIQFEEKGMTLEDMNKMELKEIQVLFDSCFKTLVQGCSSAKKVKVDRKVIAILKIGHKLNELWKL